MPKNILSVIQSKKFNSGNSGGYHLVVAAGTDAIKVCCIEHATKECLWLSICKLPSDSSQRTDCIQCLEQLYNAHLFLLKQDWLSVTLTIANPKCVLVPQLLLSTKDLSTYLHVACGVAPSDTVVSFTHALAKVSLVFSETTAVVEWFRKRYASGNFQIIHQANALIEGFQLACPTPSKPSWFVWLDRDYVHVVVRHKTQLLYYNAFAYETANDFTHSLSMVHRTLGFAHTECVVWLGGYIEKRSLAYRQLKSQLPLTKFKEAIRFMDPNVRAGFRKRQLAPMVYFDLMSSLLCHTHVPHSKH